MTTYLLRRIGSSLIALWLVLTLVFFALHLAGDPVRLMLDPSASEETVAAFRESLGYDAPLVVQYLRFLGSVATFSFPDSLRFRVPASDVVLDKVGPTAELAVTAIVIAVAVALLVGYLGAQARRGWVRALVTWPVSVLQAFPTFYLGVVLALVVGVQLGWLPTGGAGTPAHLVLPALTLALALVPAIARTLRASTVRVAGEDFVRTARARGLRRSEVVGLHILPNALLPVITVIGLELGTVLGGSIVLEKVFSWPGLGQLMITSVVNRDYPVVLASVTFLAVVFIVLNLLVDVAYGLIDPRIRIGARGRV